MAIYDNIVDTVAPVEAKAFLEERGFLSVPWITTDNPPRPFLCVLHQDARYLKDLPIHAFPNIAIVENPIRLSATSGIHGKRFDFPYIGNAHYFTVRREDNEVIFLRTSFKDDETHRAILAGNLYTGEPELVDEHFRLRD